MTFTVDPSPYRRFPEGGKFGPDYIATMTFADREAKVSCTDKFMVRLQFSPSLPDIELISVVLRRNAALRVAQLLRYFTHFEARGWRPEFVTSVEEDAKELYVGAEHFSGTYFEFVRLRAQKIVGGQDRPLQFTSPYPLRDEEEVTRQRLKRPRHWIGDIVLDASEAVMLAFYLEEAVVRAHRLEEKS